MREEKTSPNVSPPLEELRSLPSPRRGKRSCSRRASHHRASWLPMREPREPLPSRRRGTREREPSLWSPSQLLKQNHCLVWFFSCKQPKSLKKAIALTVVSIDVAVATSDVEKNTYYVDFPGCYDALLRPSGCPLLSLELQKHTRDFWLGNSWILASAVWCFSIRKIANSKLEVRDVEVDSEATVIRWPKGHATKLTSFKERFRKRNLKSLHGKANRRQRLKQQYANSSYGLQADALALMITDSTLRRST
ncbi:hypothetical protein HN873_048120, partial [Arachis hypogaea]